MSFCGTVIRQISWLERQTQVLVSKVCRVEALEKCADWQDESYNKCLETRDEGYNECSRKEDQGYNDCCDWWPCSWACDAWVWVSHIVCVAWTWISNVVCVVWHWIVKWVCRLVYWVFTTICKFLVSIIFWFIRRVLTWVVTIPCKAGTPDLDPRIRHIFVLVLENRSFDHMLGATPIRGTDAETGRETETDRRPDDAFNDVRDTNGTVTHHCVAGTGQKRSVGADPGHEFGNTLLALCGLGDDFKSPAYPPYPPVSARPPRATLIDPVTLARARQHNPTAITSTTAGFLLVALRRDLLLAPRTERRMIYEQVRRFETVGEVAVYARAVQEETSRLTAAAARPAPRGRLRPLSGLRR